jgi:hypothetical protein
MNKKPEKADFKSLMPWVAFGVGVAFSVTILVFWIKQEITNPIPMSIFIGALIWLVFKLFSDAVKEQDHRDR